MPDGDFPFRTFTMRPEGYDRTEVDSYVSELQVEIVELRRALDTATPRSEADSRLHDPEGAVTRTLAIAQETADRVLHDAQVEADRRRADADEHATTVVSDADERAARLLGDMEAQAAEVREQGVAAARSAIQVERDKAMAELAHVRRVRDDLRTEAVDLKTSLDRYRSQAREASDSLAAAASGPLMSLDLPDFIDDDVVLAGISSGDQAADGLVEEVEAEVAAELDDTELSWADDGGETGSVLDEMPDYLEATEPAAEIDVAADVDAVADVDEAAAEIDDDAGSHLRAVEDLDATDTSETADVIDIEADQADGGGTFLAEVRAAAEDDDVALAPENDRSDSFLSELRGLNDEGGEELDSEAADTFFDND